MAAVTYASTKRALVGGSSEAIFAERKCSEPNIIAGGDTWASSESSWLAALSRIEVWQSIFSIGVVQGPYLHS